MSPYMSVHTHTCTVLPWASVRSPALAHTCLCEHTCVCTRTHVSLCPCVCSYASLCTCLCAHVPAHVFVCGPVCACMHTQVPVDIFRPRTGCHCRAPHRARRRAQVSDPGAVPWDRLSRSVERQWRLREGTPPRPRCLLQGQVWGPRLTRSLGSSARLPLRTVSLCPSAPPLLAGEAG